MASGPEAEKWKDTVTACLWVNAVLMCAITTFGLWPLKELMQDAAGVCARACARACVLADVHARVCVCVLCSYMPSQNWTPQSMKFAHDAAGHKLKSH